MPLTTIAFLRFITWLLSKSKRYQKRIRMLDCIREPPLAHSFYASFIVRCHERLKPENLQNVGSFKECRNNLFAESGLESREGHIQKNTVNGLTLTQIVQ